MYPKTWMQWQVHLVPVHPVPTQTRTTLGHVAMKHADDVNALEEASHVSKNMDATAIIHPVPIQMEVPVHPNSMQGTCCNDACRQCQRGGGGKACIQKHGCSANPSSTNSNMGHAAMNPNNVNVVEEARHVSKDTDAMAFHPTPANLNAKKEGIRVSIQEVKSVTMEKLQNHAMDMII